MAPTDFVLDANKRTRKRNYPQNPNSHIIEWLTEWRDEAATKGWKTQYTFAKCIVSLKKYPLRIQSGLELKMLDYFGEKTCGMIEKKLVEWRKTNGSSCGDRDDGRNELLGSTTSFHGLSSSDEESTTSLSQKKVQKPRKPVQRAYIPIKGTGPYALLVTLSRMTLGPNCRPYMRKDDLINAAQPLSVKSFLIPDMGSYYTAWNSMATLISKGLVLKESHPAKYSLTEDGRELAERLIAVENGQPVAQLSQQKQNGVAKQGDVTEQNGVLKRNYINKQNGVASKRPAQKPPKSLATKCSKPSAVASKPCLEFSDSDDDCQPSTSSSVPKSVAIAREPYSSSSNYNSSNAGSSQSTNSIFLSNPAVSRLQSEPVAPESPVDMRPIFTLRPGSFEVVLCVDTRETAGGVGIVGTAKATDSRKQEIINGLRANGVDFDVRILNVGDFGWVVRERTEVVPGMLHKPKGKEAITDFIMERKRMDDLSHSITDGRFKEQKFRMKNCGLLRPIYLVEECGLVQSAIPSATLRQAITNTQVINGFTVKVVPDTCDTVAYLTLMTRYLQGFYKDKTVEAYNRRQLDAMTKWQREDGNRLLIFDEFNANAVKLKPSSIRDMFAKQLMQVKGLSFAKVCAIIKIYPTPISLLKAYLNCASEKEKINLVATVKYGTLHRNVGGAVSRMMYNMYCSAPLV